MTSGAMMASVVHYCLNAGFSSTVSILALRVFFSKIFVLAHEGISPNWWRNIEKWQRNNLRGYSATSGQGATSANIVISDTKKPSQQIIN
jgi:hypothetical protein